MNQKLTNVFNYASTSNGIEEEKNLIDLYIEAKLKQWELNTSGKRPLLKRLFLRNQIAMLKAIEEVISMSAQQSNPSFLAPLLTKKIAAVSTSSYAEQVEPVIRSSSRRKSAHPQKCIQQEEEDVEIDTTKSRKRSCSNEDQISSKQPKLTVS